MLVDCDCRGKFGRGRVGEIYHDLFSLGEIFFFVFKSSSICMHACINTNVTTVYYPESTCQLYPHIGITLNP